MTVTLAALQDFLTRELALSVWPFFRVAGVLMVAPVVGARLVPARVRIALAVAVTVVIAPLVPAAPPLAPSLVTVLLLVQEVLLGAAIGMCLQMVFDALIIAAETIAMSVGLGFATMVDPQRGVTVPVLGQFFVILGTLIFLSLGGHLALLELIAGSFATAPIGVPFTAAGAFALVAFGTEMFAGAVRIALPAITALLVVNAALGVTSRAAPQLNLFAVGLPLGMLLGFAIILLNLENLAALTAELLEAAFAAAGGILAP